MAGQRAQVAGGGDEFGKSADLVGARSDGAAARGSRASRASICLDPFLGLERAGAIDDACRRAFVSAAARSSSRRCSAMSPARSASRLSQATSGWRRIVPVDEQGASSSTASNGPACHSRRVGRDGLGAQAEPGEIFATGARGGSASGRRRSPRRRPARVARSCRRAPRTGRRPCGRDVAEQARRQRRGGVLHPPRAFGVAGQQRDRPCAIGAHACRSAARGRAAAPPSSSGSPLTVRSSARLLADARSRWRARSRRHRRRSSAPTARAACRGSRCRDRRAGPARRATTRRSTALTSPA